MPEGCLACWSQANVGAYTHCRSGKGSLAYNVPTGCSYNTESLDLEAHLHCPGAVHYSTIVDLVHADYWVHLDMTSGWCRWPVEGAEWHEAERGMVPVFAGRLGQVQGHPSIAGSCSAAVAVLA